MGSRTLVAAILMASAAPAVPAQAAAAGQFVSATVLFGAPTLTAMPGTCNRGIAAGAQQSKAEALLGGAPSALSRITSAQEASVAPAAFVQTASTCTAIGKAEAVQGSVLAPVIQIRRNPEDFLSSTRLSVSRTPFDRDWARVNGVGLRAVAMKPLHLSPGRTDPLALLSKVNAWANQNVRYEDDKALYGRPDYWASAPQTLRRRAGDCEDIAILKYHLLARAGVPRDTMFLTVARDLARNADHAVLVVRIEGRYWLLDNAAAQLIDASSANDYRPIFSYSSQGKWLHGYRGNLATTAATLPTPALNAR